MGIRDIHGSVHKAGTACCSPVGNIGRLGVVGKARRAPFGDLTLVMTLVDVRLCVHYATRHVWLIISCSLIGPRMPCSLRGPRPRVRILSVGTLGSAAARPVSAQEARGVGILGQGRGTIGRFGSRGCWPRGWGWVCVPWSSYGFSAPALVRVRGRSSKGIMGHRVIVASWML